MIYFRLEYLIRGLRLSIPEHESLRFAFGGPHNIGVILRCPTQVEQNEGYKLEDAFCTALAQHEPRAKIRAIFESLAARKLPPGSGEIERPDSDHIDEDGNIKDEYVVPLELLPQPFQAFCDHAQDELWDRARRTVYVARWRFAVPGPHNPFSFRGMYWSFDGSEWVMMGRSFAVFVEALDVLEIQDQANEEVREFVEQGMDEPLGHQLLREAWQQRLSNPRSSIVVGIAALEIGFKQLVGRLVPEAKWLVENAPSPPVVNMLRDYLPRLPARNDIGGRVLPPPPEVLDVLKKGVSARNQIAHVGTPGTSPESAEEVLLGVRDVLWLLDYYSGFSWALGHMRRETRQRLEPV